MMRSQNHNFLMVRGDDPFPLGNQLFVKLLAWSQAREDDLDILLRFEAIESK